VGGRAEELVPSSFVVVFSPVLPTRFVPGRMRQLSDDARTASITLGLRLKSSREEAAWRWGARGRKRARRRKNCKKLRVEVWPGNKEMQVVRACFPNEKVKLFLRPLEL
jgi:hypothetical protein